MMEAFKIVCFNTENTLMKILDLQTLIKTESSTKELCELYNSNITY